jgi:hypothetical protein
VGLLIAIFLITTAIEFINHLRVIGSTSFTHVTFLFTETGTRHEVAVPRDMKIEDFVAILCRTLAKRAPRDTALSHEYMYDKALLVQRPAEYKEVDPKLTVNEAGIQSGDVLKVRGRIRPLHSMVSFCGGTAESRARYIKEMQEDDQTYYRYASLALSLNETPEGEKTLQEYLLAETFRPE